MKEAQQLFLNALIADVTLKDAKMMVTFANDLFKKNIRFLSWKKTTA